MAADPGEDSVHAQLRSAQLSVQRMTGPGSLGGVTGDFGRYFGEAVTVRVQLAFAPGSHCV
jgi:hypothetical protein